MKHTNSMSHRLKHARTAAGYRTATAAIEKLNWNASTYRAHENGQNNFNVANAEKYAKAYSVTAAWLLVGDDAPSRAAKTFEKKLNPKCKKSECPEKIYALALLLRDDPQNISLVNTLVDCVRTYSALL